MIHRIESGKIKPSREVARKLSKRLGVRFLVAADEEEDESVLGEAKKDLTLGDLVVVKKRGAK